MEPHETEKRLPKNFEQSIRPHLWKSGQSGNRSGRYGTRIDRLVRKMLKENSAAAAQALCDIVQDPKVPSRLRCHAAEVILDRVYGKPKLPIDLAVGGKGETIVFRFEGTLPDAPQETKAVTESAPAPEKPVGGLFRPGVSANPGGRRKYDPKVKKALVEGSLAAAETLCEFVNDPNTPPGTRIRASEAVLDRLYGRAAQPVYAAAEGPVEIRFEGVLNDWAG